MPGPACALRELARAMRSGSRVTSSVTVPSRATRDLLLGTWTPALARWSSPGRQAWRLATQRHRPRFVRRVAIDMGRSWIRVPMDDLLLASNRSNTRPRPTASASLLGARQVLGDGPAERTSAPAHERHVGGTRRPDHPTGAASYVTDQQGRHLAHRLATPNTRPERPRGRPRSTRTSATVPRWRIVVIPRRRIEKTDSSEIGPQVKEQCSYRRGGESADRARQLLPPHHARLARIYDPVDGAVSMRWDGTDRRGQSSRASLIRSRVQPPAPGPRTR
jgi:hypothetical protein